MAFEEYWVSDPLRVIERRQMIDAIQKLDASHPEAELNMLFDAVDKNHNGSIEYEEFIDSVFNDVEVVDLASQELDLLQLAVEGSSAMDDEAAIQLALEASASEQAAEMARHDNIRLKEQEQDRLTQEASAREFEDEVSKKATAMVAADEELEAASRASEETAAEQAERIQKQHEEEDGSPLFRAALRASCLDLGPRGVSQAAKVFATGDPSVGQPRAGFDLKTSGAKGRRSAAATGTAPAFTGTEVASEAPVAARSDSPAALKRQAELAARATGVSASRR